MEHPDRQNGERDVERFDERLVVNEDSGNKFYQVIPCADGKFVLYAALLQHRQRMEG